jgi:hypothetical protein
MRGAHRSAVVAVKPGGAGGQDRDAGPFLDWDAGKGFATDQDAPETQYRSIGCPRYTDHHQSFQTAISVMRGVRHVFCKRRRVYRRFPAHVNIAFDGTVRGVAANHLHGCERFHLQNESRGAGARCRGSADHLGCLEEDRGGIGGSPRHDAASRTYLGSPHETETIVR